MAGSDHLEPSDGELARVSDRGTGSWDEIKAVFVQILDLDEEERRALLDRSCANDPEMRREVERLLEADAAAPSFLDASVSDLAAAALAPDLDGEDDNGERAIRGGERVGAWRLIEELGQGGMGVVYLAERADGQFDQRVALKLVKLGIDPEAILRRFLNERQVLATLQHPHIAHLYDGGVTEPAPAQAAGTPWFAMEYVEGVPITEFCVEDGLSLEERIRLFQSVCRAVQHAHNRLIIHRDLKPSNILVTRKGEPRLLDFGLAKLLSEDLSGMPASARLTDRWMTLEYASPEQVKGEPLTTASDTYQLGLILYELVAGKPAYIVEGLSLTEAVRVICEVDPPKPSTVCLPPAERKTIARTAAENLTSPPTPDQGQARASRGHVGSLLQGRSPHLDKWRKRLKGDLDTIIQKALDKNPDRRYTSAETLANDLERYLKGLPIHARPDTFGYRSRKFLRRHRWGIAAAAAIAVSLIGGLGAALWQAHVAGNERDRAQIEREKSDQVTSFLINLFESSNPDEALGVDLTARQLLDRGMEKAAELPDQPEVQARMYEAIGYTYRRLGLYAEARRALEQALALRQEVFGQNHVDVAQSLHDLGALLLRQREYDAAEKYLRQAETMQRDLLGDNDPDLASTIDELAKVYQDQGQYDEAIALRTEALNIFRNVQGENHIETATSYCNLGLLLYYAYDLANSENYLRRCVATYRDSLGSKHPWVATAMHNLSLTLQDKGDLLEAERLSREVVELDRELLGQDHPQLANHMYTLANALHAQGKHSEAFRILEEAITIVRSRPGDTQWLLPIFLTSRGEMYLEVGRPDDAEAVLGEAIDLARQVFSEEHWRVGRAIGLLGSALAAQGQFSRAEPLLVESYTLIRKNELRRMKFEPQAIQRLVDLYERWGKPERAAGYRALLEKADG